nr:immunoglobulin light chain junction region [Macaca mulatta]
DYYCSTWDARLSDPVF